MVVPIARYHARITGPKRLYERSEQFENKVRRLAQRVADLAKG